MGSEREARKRKNGLVFMACVLRKLFSTKLDAQGKKNRSREGIGFEVATFIGNPGGVAGIRTIELLADGASFCVACPLVQVIMRRSCGSEAPSL